jgi:hypothetical protein
MSALFSLGVVIFCSFLFLTLRVPVTHKYESKQVSDQRLLRSAKPSTRPPPGAESGPFWSVMDPEIFHQIRISENCAGSEEAEGAKYDTNKVTKEQM